VVGTIILLLMVSPIVGLPFALVFLAIREAAAGPKATLAEQLLRPGAHALRVAVGVCVLLAALPFAAPFSGRIAPGLAEAGQERQLPFGARYWTRRVPLTLA